MGLQNSKKRAERSERLMYEQSHRDYLRSGYSHHRLPVAAVNHYRDNAITYKAQRDKKCQRTGWRTRQLLTCADASGAMLLRSMQNTRRILTLKLKMMLCVMMLPLVVVGCTSGASPVSQCVKLPPPPACGAMQLSPLADTAERDYFTPERG